MAAKSTAPAPPASGSMASAGAAEQRVHRRRAGARAARARPRSARCSRRVACSSASRSAWRSASASERGGVDGDDERGRRQQPRPASGVRASSERAGSSPSRRSARPPARVARWPEVSKSGCVDRRARASTSASRARLGLVRRRKSVERQDAATACNAPAASAAIRGRSGAGSRSPSPKQVEPQRLLARPAGRGRHAAAHREVADLGDQVDAPVAERREPLGQRRRSPTSGARGRAPRARQPPRRRQAAEQRARRRHHGARARRRGARSSATTSSARTWSEASTSW